MQMTNARWYGEDWKRVQQHLEHSQSTSHGNQASNAKAQMPKAKCTNAICANVQMHKCSNAKCSNAQIDRPHKCPNAQMHNAQMLVLFYSILLGRRVNRSPVSRGSGTQSRARCLLQVDARGWWRPLRCQSKAKAKWTGQEQGRVRVFFFFFRFFLKLSKYSGRMVPRPSYLNITISV